MQPLVVVMGVAASGKSSIGALLAGRLGVPFGEGDALHPDANVAKMRAGIALDDADRAPWLDAIAGWIGAHRETGGVMSCSALKRAYRDRLRIADPQLRFLFLAVGDATLRARLATRRGHFMPATLLASQLATLEPPSPDEPDILTVDGAADLHTIVATMLDRLARDRAG